MPLSNSNLPPSLVYSSDDDPGITRRGAGKGFAYYDTGGQLITDQKIKKRLNSLAIPPAYNDVWLCADPMGHLQATGLDERKRKQYRYHEEWTRWRGLQKFDSLIDFAKTLPSLRQAVKSHLHADDFSKETIIAAVVRLLDKTAVRIGNDAYLKENGTSGLTTLQQKDVEAEDGYLQLDFTAKGGERRAFDLYQPILAKIVENLEDLPGQRLFQYRSEHDGELHPVTSSDVNEWLKEKSGNDISAKDFRTWRASHLTLNHLLQCEPCDSERERVGQEGIALKATSRELGHRPPVCRKHYVHPLILKHHRNGILREKVGGIEPVRGLLSEEENLWAFLHHTKDLTEC